MNSPRKALPSYLPATLSVLCAFFLVFFLSLPAFAEEEPSEEPSTPAAMRYYGDVDADQKLSAADARLILRTAVRLENLDPEALAYADMDHDGKIAAADARLALRTSVELEELASHQFSVVVKAENTCTAEGKLDYACAECGLAVELTTPPLGHTTKEISTVPATCTQPGSVELECEICGEKIQKKLYPLGHKWVDADASAAKHCKVCGEIVTGWTQLANGDWHFSNENGTVPKGKAVVETSFKSISGYWYLVNGVLQQDVRTAVSLNGKDWIVTAGRAKPVETEADKTLFRAFREVEKATTPDMTKEEKLKACFDYVKTNFGESRPRTPHYVGLDWPVIYANDMFVNGSGNCFSYAAAFGYMAKAIGYKNVFCCNSSDQKGIGGHGWTEIDGLIYDTEWSKWHTEYSYYGLSYNDRTDVRYKEAISSGLPWMHVEI